MVQQSYGKQAGWVVAASSLLLCGFGIYLGRFLRENSWDVFVHPLLLFQTIAARFDDPGSQPHPIVVTLVFGIGLIIGYLVLRVFSPSSHSAAIADKSANVERVPRSPSKPPP